jgi:hypothetical protein
MGLIQPAVLPILRPPAPIFRMGRVFIVHGGLLQVIGERWRAEDAAHCPAPTEPDKQRPGVAITMYLRDPATGEVFSPVSADAVSGALAGRHPRGSSRCRPANPRVGSA